MDRVTLASGTAPAVCSTTLKTWTVMATLIGVVGFAFASLVSVDRVSVDRVSVIA